MPANLHATRLQIEFGTQLEHINIDKETHVVGSAGEQLAVVVVERNGVHGVAVEKLVDLFLRVRRLFNQL
jgi:hypothetical protein